MGCFPDYVGLHIVGTVVRIVSIRVLCRRRYVLSSIDNIVDDLDDEFSDTGEEKLDVGDKMIENANTFNDYL